MIVWVVLVSGTLDRRNGTSSMTSPQNPSAIQHAIGEKGWGKVLHPHEFLLERDKPNEPSDPLFDIQNEDINTIQM